MDPPPEKLEDHGKKIAMASPHYGILEEYPFHYVRVRWGEGFSAHPEEVLEMTIESKILVYEDRVKGWFLDFARKLSDQRHGEFIVMMICVAYLEGNQQFREGRGTKLGSGQLIKKAMHRLFRIPESHNKVLNMFVDQVRCGLFHDGMTRNHILLNYNTPYAMMVDEHMEIIIINPKRFIMAVEKDFDKYIKSLKDENNREERAKFLDYWDFTNP